MLALDISTGPAVSLRESAPAASAMPAPRSFVPLHFLLIVLAAVFMTRVLWTPALLAGHSAWQDFTRMVEFDAAIRAGDYFPTWSPDLYSGYGSPLFQFYAPLVYYMTEVPVLAGMDIASAMKFTQVLMLIASGIAMYHLASAHVSRWAACFGALLYMVAPYRILDLFVRHAHAEHAAFVWLPLIVWGTAGRTRAQILTAALATAGLILTHNVMALIALPVCLMTGLWLRGGNWRETMRAVLPALVGVGLTAFFWWPALSGRAATKAKQSLTQGYFDYRQHFVSAHELIDPAWGFGETGIGAVEKMPLQIGLPHLLMLVAAGAVLLRREARTRWGVGAILIAAGATLLCHGLSQPLWANIPLLKYVQFPWRFLSLVVFGAAMSGAALIEHVRRNKPRIVVPIFAAVGIAVLISYFPYYRSAYFLAATETQPLVRVAPNDVVAMRNAGVLVALDRIITPGKIRAVGERATSGDDFLPRAVQEKPTAPATELIATTSGKVAQQTRTGVNQHRAQISLPSDGMVQLRQFWFPGWTASIDGHPAETFAEGTNGIVACRVPAGDHVVDFKYTALPQRRAGVLASALSAVALVAIWFWRAKGGTRWTT